jgi:AraC family transcriptional regulator, regulatory protein of adaptative response / DNA-3-methyladenine glycosylase II
LASEQPTAFPMPASRRQTLAGLAGAVASGDLAIDPGAHPDEVRSQLLALPGIGSWTADYIAMRALGDPDAFLPTDLGVRRAIAQLGAPDDPRAVAALAERWRPWRAYALAHLWGTLASDPSVGRAHGTAMTATASAA